MRYATVGGEARGDAVTMIPRVGSAVLLVAVANVRTWVCALCHALRDSVVILNRKDPSCAIQMVNNTCLLVVDKVTELLDAPLGTEAAVTMPRRSM